MQTNINELEINGRIYVPKDSVPNAPILDQDISIVRCKEAGVFFGKVVKTDLGNGGAVEMTNARRVWYWSGAASISQLAISGSSKPNDCKIPEAVPRITLAGCIEIIPCTAEAAKNLSAIKPWKQ